MHKLTIVLSFITLGALFSCVSLPMPNEPSLEDITLTLKNIQDIPAEEQQDYRALQKQELQELLERYAQYKIYIFKMREFKQLYEQQ